MDVKDSGSLNAPPRTEPLPDSSDEDAARDRELIEQIRHGHRAAWDALYQRMTPRFHVLAVRTLAKQGLRPERSAIEDLVHGVWKHILEKRERVFGDFEPSKGIGKGQALLNNWLLQIARNEMFSLIRSPGLTPWSRELRRAKDEHEPDARPADSQLAAQMPSPEEAAMVTQEIAQTAQTLSEHFTGRELEPVIRVLVHDEEARAVAQSEGIKTNTLYQRISRVRKLLKR